MLHHLQITTHYTVYTAWSFYLLLLCLTDDSVVFQAAARPSRPEEQTTATSASWPSCTTTLAKTCPEFPCRWLSMSRCLCCRGSVKSWSTQTCWTPPTTLRIRTREWSVWSAPALISCGRVESHANFTNCLQVYVAAFSISGYAWASWRYRYKPFNPVLGETYESHREDRGFRYVSEQVIRRVNKASQPQNPSSERAVMLCCVLFSG